MISGIIVLIKKIGSFYKIVIQKLCMKFFVFINHASLLIKKYGNSLKIVFYKIVIQELGVKFSLLINYIFLLIKKYGNSLKIILYKIYRVINDWEMENYFIKKMDREVRIVTLISGIFFGYKRFYFILFKGIFYKIEKFVILIKGVSIIETLKKDEGEDTRTLLFFFTDILIDVGKDVGRHYPVKLFRFKRYIEGIFYVGAYYNLLKLYVYGTIFCVFGYIQYRLGIDAILVFIDIFRVTGAFIVEIIIGIVYYVGGGDFFNVRFGPYYELRFHLFIKILKFLRLFKLYRMILLKYTKNYIKRSDKQGFLGY